MNKRFIFVIATLIISIVYADKYPIDLTKIHPKCGDYVITESSTRKEAIENCQIVDKRNLRIRFIRGVQTLILNTNIGPISCSFFDSLINQNGSCKGCWTTNPPPNKTAIINIQNTLSTESPQKTEIKK
jgi:hypothetical protein